MKARSRICRFRRGGTGLQRARRAEVNHPHVGHAPAVTLPALGIRKCAQRDDVAIGLQRVDVVVGQPLPRFELRRDVGEGHLHRYFSFTIDLSSSSALRRAASVVTSRLGHSRVNPSPGHLRVASMPILLP